MIGLIVLTLSTVNAVALFVVLRLSRNHAIERADMLDRLMSRNLEEYKTFTDTPVAPSGPVDITEQEEYEREIVQMKSGL